MDLARISCVLEKPEEGDDDGLLTAWWSPYCKDVALGTVGAAEERLRIACPGQH